LAVKHHPFNTSSLSGFYYFRFRKQLLTLFKGYSMLQDSYRHKGLRKKLVETLREKGITDEKVLQAIERVPRHLFLDSSFLEYAYQDKAFPIGSGQTISQPYTVAYQTQLLQLQPGDKVLEIGTGSGFQSCVLVEMGAKVYTIERQKKLFEKTKAFLPTIGYNPKMFYGDGYKGLPPFAPFDRIIITAAAPEIPSELINQMKIGAILVIPVGPLEQQTMVTIQKISESETVRTEHARFRFVPMLGNKAKD
jgi:protein-L-isoaspartate(D-aspartate) O-methyltransferase